MQMKVALAHQDEEGFNEAVLLLVPLKVRRQNEVHAQKPPGERLDASLKLQPGNLVDHLLDHLAQAGGVDELAQLRRPHVKVSAL